MSWSREEALTDPAIREPLKFLSEFRFSLRDIPVEITIRLYQPVHSGRIVIRRSHDIAVDGIIAGKAYNYDEESSEGEALQAAVCDLVSVYNAARAKELKPDRSWLKANADFQ
ncbi:MAG TPA: hypothetical protein VLK27_08620 [Chthoniobacterales bacterium]|nr:hypothetical protein [Chthoniobacterales bacterium]